MMRKVKIPKIDANIEEATVGRWLKAEGDAVRRGEPIVELITDKAVFEFESPAAGLLRRIVAPEKSVLPVQSVIALIGDADAPLPDVSEDNRRLVERHRAGAAPTPEPPAAAAETAPDDGAVRATPAARRLAREHGLDLAAVKAATGAARITEETIRGYLAGGKP